jgi:hypothetical protein
MTNRFPAPWRIVEMATGFAVEDATGQQLGVFYGRSDQNAAGHTGFLTMDEARQMAVDFAKLPKLLSSFRDEVAKATPQHESQNGKHIPTRQGRLADNLAPHSEIFRPDLRRGAD